MRAVRCLVLLVLLLPVAAGVRAVAARGQAPDVEFADWTAVVVSGTADDVATGTLLGHSITLTGGFISPEGQSVVNGTWNAFNTDDFTPPIALTDMLQIGEQAGVASNNYVLAFGAPVTNPRLHLFSLGSTLTFAGAVQIVKLSGDDTFTVSGATVNGVPVSQPGSADPNGTVELVGIFSSIAFTARHPQTFADGVPMTVLAPIPAFTPEPTPDPSPTPLATASPSPTPLPTPIPTASPPPRPIAGVSVTTQSASGTVTVKVPAGQDFVPLGRDASVPVGSLVDARRGSVAFTAAIDDRGRTASAELAAGIFAIRQARAHGATAAVPEFALVTPPGSARACATGKAPHKGVRTLSIVAKGLFRTVAAKGVTATGRNATWTTADRCDGTLTKVRRGRVAVRSRHSTLTVTAGHNYLLKAKLFAARRGH